jgi:starch phosphorylase
MPHVFPFDVIPSLPERLRSLDDLSLNLRWTWDHPTVELFRGLDPDLWEETHHNPRLMLSRVGQRRLVELTTDEAFLAQLDRAATSLKEYTSAAGSFPRTHPQAAGLVFAYFCAEFGIAECAPNYAGGLGILAGDHLKSASDLGLPLVGVGLLYQRGYFQQYLNADGWQQETYPVNDFSNLPITLEKDQQNKPLAISVEFPGRSVWAHVWKAQVGRVPLYVLDTNVPPNSTEDRRITDSLYGGDNEMRLQQEMMLGIGGFRALRALGIRPTVCHMNEGHSAFLGLERTRTLMEEMGLPFFEARQLAAAGNLFTTHTPVPAGFDRFEPRLMEKYFRGMADRLSIPFDRLLGYGRQNPSDSNESFTMAFLAARVSSAANAESRLHGVVTRKMVQAMWPGYPVEEIPVQSLTNGVHTRSWTSDEMGELLSRYLGPRWAEEPDGGMWNRVDRIPDHELWRVHQIRRERLVYHSRQALEAQLRRRGSTDAEIAIARGVLNPDVLTIGFARRFASYKRATLLLRDTARIKRILKDPSRPVQILFAGKAHPQDNPGKDLIRQLVHFSRDPDVRHNVVFLEDYDMSLARRLVRGVDVWLNTPRRPNEASGTSGMKVLPNGGLNLSILDGWWDEAYDREVGWAIGNGEEYTNEQYQDEVESEALYNLLEKNVAPLFYERDEENLPRRWIAKMKASMKQLCPVFNTNRMVTEYAERFYLPASQRYLRLAADGGARTHAIAEWRRRIRLSSSRVKISQIQADTQSGIPFGTKLPVTASVFLADIPPDYVRVQIVSGSLNAEGIIVHGKAVDMARVSSNGEENVYRGEVECGESGSCGFTVRVIPYHEDVIVPYEHPWVLWNE